MPTDLPPHLIPFVTLATGLAIGWALGRWFGSRTPGAAALKVDLQGQMETLARAREASEQANSELREALDQLELAAGTDRLTGAWNRRRFEDGAGQLIALAGRRGGGLCLILFDLDRFKQVNDLFGHSVGDEVLVSVTETVRDQLRASDALARWGGEEFIVLCPATTLAGATILAEKIRHAVQARAIPKVGLVTLSLGVAQHQKGEALEAWVNRADGALYRAKERGRNRTETCLDLSDVAGEEPPSILELTWDSALESGNPEIDHQHQQLFHISNGLLRSITSGRYPEDARLQMQLLLAHVAQHFHDEETILARTGYPELAAHAAEHHRLITKAKALQHDMGGVSTDLPALLTFLALDLVKGHLLGWDRRFFSHLAKS